MNDRRMDLYPNRKQYLFLQSRTRHTAYGGARGGGKSWVIRVKAVMDAGDHGRPDAFSEGIKICIIRRTLTDLIKNHLAPLKNMTNGIAIYNQNEKKFTFKNGATIQLMYCDNDNDADHFQGIEFDEIFIEEATQLKPEWLTIIATSCRGVNNFPHRVYYTCNPGGPGHEHIKRLFVDRIYKENENPEDYSFIQAMVTDNKILMERSPEYVTFLQNLPPKLRDAWLYGSWQIWSGQYFSDFVFDPDHLTDGLWTHVIDPIERIPKHWTLYRGFDWGSYRPFSVGWYAVDEEGIMYRFKELYGVQKSGGESLANEGVQWPSEKVFRKIYEIEQTDPNLKGREIIGIADKAIFQKESTGISIADTAAECGVYFQPSDSSRLAGWEQCRIRLQFDKRGVPRFYVTSNCKEFIRTIPLLQHDKHDGEDIDTEGEDHIADEWRYVCMRNLIKAQIETPQYEPAYGADPLNMFGGSA